ncbi:MAG: hypothetical protein KJO42_07110 [Silicimonas sp.]|nr:hypothetical protein [Silicimonas sp.]
MFDQNFLLGALVLALTVLAAFALAALTGLDPTLTVVGTAAAVWGIAALIERRGRPDPADEPSPILVAWEDKLSDTDFAADGPDTLADLQARDLTPETAIGQMLIFATEHETSNGDIWFEGQFIRDGDRIVIRATEPV